MSKYIDSEKLIAEIERHIKHYEKLGRDDFKNGELYICQELLSFVKSLQQEQPEVDLEKEEFVGVAESPLKTFPRVNDFECGGSYRH